MADSTTDQREIEPGFGKLKQHIILNKIDFALWVTRFFSIFFTIGYFIPLFWNPYTLYYKALMSNASTSALRLHQRLPQVSFTKQFLQQLLLEDSCHYLFYSIIFLYIAPVTSVALQPIFFFSLLHSASYSLSLLDCLGQNSWWGARLLISLIEFQSRNLLRLISFTEIFLMPFSVFLLLIGHASLLTPFLYYQFLYLRYASRRNPYTRNLFHELRLFLESTASKPGVPQFIRQALLFVVSVGCRLAPTVQNVILPSFPVAVAAESYVSGITGCDRNFNQYNSNPAVEELTSNIPLASVMDLSLTLRANYSTVMHPVI